MPVNAIDRQLTLYARKKHDLDAQGIRHTFSQSVLRESRLLRLPTDELEKRPKVPGFAIDPVDAHEIDDAVWVGRTAQGFIARVSIADPCAAIPEKSALDLEAQARASTLYFHQQFLPMIPVKAINRMELLAGLDRLVLTVEMDFNEAGQRTATNIYEATLTGTKALTYAETYDALRDQSHPCHQELTTASMLAQLLFNNRSDRQAMAFLDSTRNLLSDESGWLLQLDKSMPLSSYLIVQEAMIAANTAVAEFLIEHNAPLLFRVHEPNFGIPERQRAIGLLNTYLRQGNPGQYNRLMRAYLKRACYSTENLGHYGLNLGAYAHFTSPLRRYVDILLHRVVKALIHGELSAERAAAFQRQFEELGPHLSEYPRQAEEAILNVLKKKRPKQVLMPEAPVLTTPAALPLATTTKNVLPASVATPKQAPFNIRPPFAHIRKGTEHPLEQNPNYLMALAIASAIRTKEIPAFLVDFFAAPANYFYPKLLMHLRLIGAIGKFGFAPPARGQLGVSAGVEETGFARRAFVIIKGETKTTLGFARAASIISAKNLAAYLLLRDWVLDALIDPAETDNTSWQAASLDADKLGQSTGSNDYYLEAITLGVKAGGEDLELALETAARIQLLPRDIAYMLLHRDKHSQLLDFLRIFFAQPKSFDYKSIIVELSQKSGLTDHAFVKPAQKKPKKWFSCRCQAKVDDQVRTSREPGISTTPKLAEHAAAYLFLRDLVNGALVSPDEINNSVQEQPDQIPDHPKTLTPKTPLIRKKAAPQPSSIVLLVKEEEIAADDRYSGQPYSDSAWHRLNIFKAKNPQIIIILRTETSTTPPSKATITIKGPDLDFEVSATTRRKKGARMEAAKLAWKELTARGLVS